MTIWFTSDLHIGHNLVSAIRGFHEGGTPGIEPADPRAVRPSTSWHDSALAVNWDSVVQKDDMVYVLGDISINGGQHALDWFEKRPGRKVLIAGNHDPVAGFHSAARKVQAHWMQYFESIHDYLQISLGGQKVLLSHYPYMSWGDGPNRPQARYEQFRLPDLGMPLLHAHTHGPEKAHGHSYHVGLDAHGLQLVSGTEIEKWLKTL